MTERIDIVISERGARTVNRSIRDIGTGAEATARRINLLRSALGLIGGAAVIQTFGRLADSFTLIQNRLRLVTTGTENLAEVTDRLFGISNRTRVGFEETGELYARLAQATKDLGTSQEDLLQFTESLNQAVILSGASAQEAQAGILQLSQGLASGALRGDELRSVLEQLPAVADVIARSLGVTRGELRQLGTDGEITAEVVLNAFREAAEGLDRDFATTVPTIGQAFTVLRNNVLQAVGAFDAATGASAAFASAILTIANNIPTVINVIQTIVQLIGVQLARIAIPAAIVAFRALTAAIAANPLGLLLTVIATAISALIAFSDQLNQAGGAFRQLATTVQAVVQLISSGFQQIFAALQAVFPPLQQFESVWPAIAAAANNAILLIVEGFDILVAAGAGAVEAIVAAWNNLPGAFIEIATAAIEGAVRVVQAGVNQIIGLINSIPFVDGAVGEVNFSGITDALSGLRESTGSPLATGFSEGFDAQRGQITERLEGIRQTIEATNRLRDTEQELQTTLRGTIDEVENLNTANQNSVAASGAAADALGSGGGGLGGAARSAAKDVEDLAETVDESSNFMQSALETTFNAASSALSNFVRTGEFDFEQFTRSLLADLTQLAANQLLQQLLGGGGGGGGGGIFGGLFGGGGGLFGGGGGLFGGLGGLFGFNNGGSILIGGQGGIDNNLLSINNRPVARVSRGETIDVNPRGQGGGNNRPVTVNFAVTTPTGEIPLQTQNQLAAKAVLALNTADRRNN
ncbi:tail length tape measure protein [Alphaproteobacteria phage PhiJL001]|uniref:Tail length tape measure protein n=1 Tax=Alphaproteobacteria phage PhiJL001 TaxID=2681607 RepID=Q5DN23_9CAUD|nr:tail length tape measure protein [Alphaproteobacteria phage PhiJL001]AAT69476.1 tail length tape measure protein [Alphaproteobacteria phage PhiJL001]